MPAKFYAVKIGLESGIYESWPECQKNVNGYPGAIFKGFQLRSEAESFLGINNIKQDTSGHCSRPTGSTQSEQSAPPVEVKENEGVAFVDGSFTDSVGYPSYAAVFFTTDNRTDISGKVEDESLYSMRNVAGEIEGAKQAILMAVSLGLKKITIYHDYQGISSWCTGEWKANKEGTISYRDFYRDSLQFIEIEFEKVKGHAGIYYNEEADKLAKKVLGIA